MSAHLAMEEVTMPMAERMPSEPFAPLPVDCRSRDDGAVILDSALPLATYPETLGSLLRQQAAGTPDRLFLAERSGDGWREVTYREALASAEHLAAAMLERGLGPRKPLMALSGNSVDLALLILAGYLSGIPVVPVSPAYSLVATDPGKLTYMRDLIGPGAIYAGHGGMFAKALDALRWPGQVEVVSAEPGHADQQLLSDWQQARVGDRLRAAETAVTADTIAKVLFTSGSTGMPKGVVNTHRMLSSNQQSLAQSWPFLEADPPVILDWLPWSHTFGGNHNFHMVLRNGGTLYIDDGKPLPGLIERSVENLRLVNSTVYFNVPSGYEALLPFLEDNEAFRRHLFSGLHMLFYAGASLADSLRQRLIGITERTLGRPVPLVTSWGTTETAPAATTLTFPAAVPGTIGAPMPGCSIKLAPVNGKLEIRVKGPNVMPGYWNNAEKTREVFDNEGYYRTGDAGYLADADRPERGIVFDGRIAENFKLTSGTWVNVGSLRVRLIEAVSPLVQDAVVVGPDRTSLCVLLIPNEAACRRLLGAAAEGASREEVLGHPDIAAHIINGLREHNSRNPGGSTCISRALITLSPPSLAQGEITDKGYINQACVRDLRADEVERLYADGDPQVLVIK